MNKYELIYIIDTTVEEAARKELIEKFNGIIAANGGEVVKVEEWGKRPPGLRHRLPRPKVIALYVFQRRFRAAQGAPVISASTRTSSVLRSSSCFQEGSVKPLRPVRVAP